MSDDDIWALIAYLRHGLRPVENKVVGIRIDDPAPDFARIAQGFGVHAEGPLDSADAVGPALRRALRVVKDEAAALVDVITPDERR
jgi:thiamine pyrophosphate-dependent acetolactate synthase large subunit-like protein